MVTYFLMLILVPISSLQAMSLRSAARVSTASRAKVIQKKPKLSTITPLKTTPTTTQQRTLYTPAKLKGLYTPLTEKAKLASPVFGAAKYESGALQRMYNVEKSDAPAVKLVRELFYKQGSQFKPTSLKSSAAYSLTSSILGLVVGALATNKLKDPNVRKNIVAQWRAEHKKLTDGDKLTQQRVETLLDLIEEASERDPNEGRSILLAFLYAKADPSGNHDMMHYFGSLNEYMPIFEDRAGLKQVLAEEKKASMEPVIKSVFMSKGGYQPAEYIATESKLREIRRDQREKFAAGEGFEQIVSYIINGKRAGTAFPLQVVTGRYGYQGQPAAPDCVETAMRDFFNILLYNPKTQSFDFTLLPPTVRLNENFKSFYETFNGIDTINNRQSGQAFMDLVSGLPGISYNRKNYELMPYPTNFVKLINYFLGIQARNVDDIGILLSDERRKITTMIETEGDHRHTVLIAMNDEKANKKHSFKILLTSGHGELDFAERKSGSRAILNAQALVSSEHQLTPQAQALFGLQVSKPKDLPSHKIPTSAYYAVDVELDRDKTELISHIFQTSTDQEALDYAFQVYAKLNAYDQRALFDFVFKQGLQKKNEKLRDLYKVMTTDTEDDKHGVFERIVKYHKELDQEALDYAYSLVASVPDHSIYHASILKDIFGIGLWKINKNFEKYVLGMDLKDIISYGELWGNVSVDFIKDLYTRLDKEGQKRLLTSVISAAHRQYMYGNRDKQDISQLVDIIKALIVLGSDVTAVDEWGRNAVYRINEMKEKGKEDDIQRLDQIIQLLENAREAQLHRDQVGRVEAKKIEKSVKQTSQEQMKPASIIQTKEEVSDGIKIPVKQKSSTSIMDTLKSWFGRLFAWR